MARPRLGDDVRPAIGMSQAGSPAFARQSLLNPGDAPKSLPYVLLGPLGQTLIAIREAEQSALGSLVHLHLVRPGARVLSAITPMLGIAEHLAPPRAAKSFRPDGPPDHARRVLRGSAIA